MTSLRRKATIVGLGCAAAVIVAVTVALQWPVVHEEWQLDRLERGDEASSRAAAEWLGKHGGVRALRRLFDVARAVASLPDTGGRDSRLNTMLNRIYGAKEQIVLRVRGEAVPFLAEVLKERPPGPQAPQMRLGAVALLGRLGPEARDAVPALMEARADPDEGFRRDVVGALVDIDGASAARP